MQMLPPAGYVGEPASSFATTFVHMSWNKVRSHHPPHAGALHTEEMHADVRITSI